MFINESCMPPSNSKYKKSDNQKPNNQNSENQKPNNQNSENQKPNNESKIHTLVLSGGAYLGLYELGVLHYIFNNEPEYLNIDKIKKIYGVSIGSFIGLLICISKISKEDTLTTFNLICEYILERPWDKLFSNKENNILRKLTNLFEKKGLFTIEIFKEAFQPIFKLAELDVNDNITIEDMYVKSGIEMHTIVINAKNMKREVLNCHTRNTLSVLDSVYMSCSLPIVFAPIFYENNYWIDGGIFEGFPLQFVLDEIVCYNKTEDGIQDTTEDAKQDAIQDATEDATEDATDDDFTEDNIFAIRFIKNKSNMEISSDMSFIQYITMLFQNIFQLLKPETRRIKNEVIIHCNDINYSDGIQCITNKEKRMEVFEKGKENAILFMTYNYPK